MFQLLCETTALALSLTQPRKFFGLKTHNCAESNSHNIVIEAKVLTLNQKLVDNI